MSTTTLTDLTVTGTLTAGSLDYTDIEASGNAAITGTLEVTGATTVDDITVGGAATVGETLDVTGATTVDDLTVGGAATVGETADITGNTTVGGTLDVTGMTTVDDLTVGGAATVAETLDVTGNVTAGADLDVTANATVGADLEVTGSILVSGIGATVDGVLSVTGQSTLTAVEADSLLVTANTVTLGTGGNQIGYGAAAPTEGTWAKGDIVFNTGVAAAGKVGWVCVTAGTPGTWQTFGVVSND